MKFIYKAKKGLNETIEGTLEAENKEEALIKLSELNLFPINVEELTALQRETAKTQKAKGEYRKKITSAEILNFTQKLTTLIRAKVDLLNSLKILYEQTENLRFKEVILELYSSIKTGKTFSESLEKFPALFPMLFIAIIKTGEISGHLDSALEQINNFLSRQEELKNRILVALAYPALLLFVGAASIFVLMTFVIPRLQPIFEGLGTDLPFITRVILKLSSFSNRIWIILAAVFLGSCFSLTRQKGRVFLTYIFTQIKLHFPVIKRLTKNQELTQFSQGLSLLLASGVPALTSLEIATTGLLTPKFKEELRNLSQAVASGQSLSKGMEILTSLPRFFTKMVAVGEESGRLTEVLEDIARSYTQQVEKDIALISSLLEPMLILILGIILGTIVLSILLPTFQITQIIH